MSDRAARAQSFQITIPVCSAREALVVTTLAELFLREGSPDRATVEHIRDDDPHLTAKALEYLMLVVNENIIPDFQQRFTIYWDEAAAEAWLSLAGVFGWSSEHLKEAVVAMQQRFQANLDQITVAHQLAYQAEAHDRRESRDGTAGPCPESAKPIAPLTAGIRRDGGALDSVEPISFHGGEA
jgi:hypothetical protein